MNESENKSNQTKLDDACYRLSQVQSSLTGLGTLFEMLSSDTCSEVSKISGVGQVLIQLAHELSSLEDTLCHLAITEDGE